MCAVSFLFKNYGRVLPPPPPEVYQFAPEKLPKPDRKGLSSKHHFSGSMLNFGGVPTSMIMGGRVVVVDVRGKPTKQTWRLKKHRGSKKMDIMAKISSRQNFGRNAMATS